MTTVDFAAFVEKLADVAADTILPFFRTALFAEDKNAGGMFDPVTEADRAAESRDASPHSKRHSRSMASSARNSFRSK